MTTALLMQFDSAEKMLEAVRALREKGISILETATPFDVEALDGALGRPVRTKIFPAVVLAGAVLGLFSGFAMQWYSAERSAPLDIGGRPLFSAPAFIPVTFVLMILGGALFGVACFAIRLRLPQPFHPLLALPSVDLSQNRFTLVVRANRTQLEGLAAPDALEEIPWT